MNLVTRNQWGHSARLGPAMKLPAVGVYLHHSVTTATNDPIADTRQIELVGKQRFGRFSYSYVIHPNGTVLEGAGLTVGAHTENHNSTTFGICLIGNYEHMTPTDAQIAAFGSLWRHLVANGRLRADAYLRPHRHVKSTACPGIRTVQRWLDFELARTEDDMSPELETMIRQIHRFLFQGLNPDVDNGGHAILTTNHFVQTVVPQWLQEVEARTAQRITDSDARTAKVVREKQCSCGGNGGGSATINLELIGDAVADELHRRLAA